MERTSDRHHILETKSDWSSNPLARKLRNTHELIPVLYRDSHELLTESCPIVPLLGYRALEIVSADFSPRDGTLNSIDRLLCSINKACNNTRMPKIERELAGLAMQSIESQIPFIKGSIVHER